MSYAGCSGPSSAIAAQFTLKMCVAAGNRKISTKNPLFWGFKVIHGHRRRHRHQLRKKMPAKLKSTAQAIASGRTKNAECKCMICVLLYL